tara:strand:- start:77 stop:1915 length:1839 start_codon:yes stop_codon:yes gene_type:complete
MPTARFYDQASYGITYYNGNPDQKITFTSSPYNWLEASFFYSKNRDIAYCGVAYDPVCSQDLKDKGFNFKIKLKEEGYLPALAIGINDIAGTGYYSSEYIVGSYGINNIDIHFGLGWGSLNGLKKSLKNPLGYLYEGFDQRPLNYKKGGGQFQASRYFSGELSPFFGVSYALNDKTLIKIEHDSTLTPGKVGYEKSNNKISLGLDYKLNKNFSLGMSFERDSYSSIRFVYKNNSLSSGTKYKYEPAETKNEWNKFTKLRANLENNGIGVNRIIETSDAIGIELTQFTHPNLNVIEEIILEAKFNSGISKDIKKDLRIANLRALSEYDKAFESNAKLIYERKRSSKFNTDTKLTLRPFLASREEFFKGAILLENNSEYIIRDNFFFSSNLKYSLADNFDDLLYPPEDTYPAQVRSDVKQYLKNFNQGVIIGRAQFDYHLSPKKNNHIMLSAGILEEMFSGFGLEYLYFKERSNFAFGIEVFDVVKRDYKMQFGALDYRNITGSINFYYRNFNIIPFDAKISYGEYLAGDEGVTFEFSRSFINGTKFGVFATFTDVSSEQFGEGSFDKGIFFNIPVYGNFINYSWRPLTKDPGAKLNRKNTLHDLLIKFRPHNS